jgi:DNA (cytosine-5)-methyltransferase 1
MSFTIGSLFDGSGGFPLAATMCGGTPLWASEIEPYPIAVTKTRFPKMKHLGSVTDIKGNEVEPVDVITFGSPCQDLSVAGKRAGLKHTDNGDEETTRSGLFMEAVRIIKEMREATNGKYPRFALWENVPGAFSSNKGEDFRIVLEELIKIAEPSAIMPAVPEKGWAYSDSYCGDGWSLAYRVLDAQFWGVPQRRRRIYLVVDFRGECAGEISFKRDGLRGYFETGRTPWQAAPGDAENCVGAADCEGAVGLDIYNLAVTGECAASITTATGQGASNTGPSVCIPVFAIDQQGGKGGANYAENVMPTLCSDSHGTPHACAYGVVSKGNGEAWAIEEKHMALSCGGGQAGQGYPCVMELTPVVAVDQGGGKSGANFHNNLSPTLTCTHGGEPAVAYGISPYHSNSMKSSNPHSGIYVADTARTLDAMNCGYPGCNQGGIAVVEPLCMATQQGGAEIMEDKCPTITAAAGMSGNNQPAVTYSVENHPADSRVNIDDSGKVQTLTSRMGTGGGNVPMVMEPTYSLETFHCVAEEEMAAPLKARDYKDPLCVCIDRAYFNQGQNALYTPQTYEDGTTPTLVAMGPSAVAYGVDCRNATEYEESNGALQAARNHNHNSNNVVRVQYIVRRLTPTECARLQGFPDRWATPDKKDSFTDEEYAFWLNVRNTKAEIDGKDVKEYTKAQMLTWYNKLHTDSAEYKLWGNGIALPCALYVMQGIAEVFANERN